MSRSPGRYLWWVARGQKATIARGRHLRDHLDGGAVRDAGHHRARIDEGSQRQRRESALDVGPGPAGSWPPSGRRPASSGTASPCQNWLIAAYRTVQVVSRHAVRLGATLPRRVSTGEVVSIGSSDLAHVGNSIEVMGRAAGRGRRPSSWSRRSCCTPRCTLGLIVLIGVPLLLVLLGPMLKPLQRRNMAQREMMGELNTLASDIVGGLRVLRGIGGEEVFHRRYVEESQRVRDGRCRGRPAPVAAGRAADLPAGPLRGDRGLARCPLRRRGRRSRPASWWRSTATRRS